jgi:hypothetical protein
VARVRAILDDVKELKNLIIDTTGIGYFEPGAKKIPDVETLNALLIKKNVKDVKVSSMKEVEIPKAEACYELQISGLG